jgi:EmrB/QacA subfamily drug resistance transporter
MQSEQPAPAVTAMTGRTRTYVALLAAAAFFMEMLDATIIVTALPTMATSFNSTALDLNITILAYTMAVGVFMPVSGWTASRFGTRRVFLLAVAVFTIASALCAASTSLPLFTAARALQGSAGAFMIAVGRLAVLGDARKSEVIGLVAIMTWPALLAPILAPPLGGLIVSIASWRWIFLINLPLGLLAIVFGMRLLPLGERGSHRPFDARGAILLSVASATLIIGVERLAQADDHLVPTLLLFATCVASSFFALRHIGQTSHPLFRLDAMRHRSFAVSIWSGSVYRVVLSAIPFMLPLMFQLCFGMSALEAGGLVMAIFLGNAAMKPFTTRLLMLFGFRTVFVATGLIIAATVYACALFRPGVPYWMIAPILFVSGLARSMQFTAFNTVTFAEVEPTEMADANTFSSVVQQITLSLGIAVSACAIRLSAHLSGTPPESLESFQWAFAMLGLAASLEIVRLARLPRDIGQSLRVASAR